jgi:putative oxidoreductase
MDALKKLAPVAHWLPRLSLAATFAYHGWPKLMDSAGMASAMGMPAIVVMLLGVVEIGGAALIVFGGTGAEWATQLAGLLFAAVMVGAIVLVHAANGWNSIGAMGMEFQVLILAVSVYFAARGNDV